jgi:putative membrane protein
MRGFVIRALLAAVGLWLATMWVSGITADDVGTLLLAGLLLGLVNAIVRPIAVILTFPITIITLGLFLLVINAAMLGLVAWFLSGLHVDGFRAAFLGSIIVSITGWIGSWLIGSRAKVEIYTHRQK